MAQALMHFAQHTMTFAGTYYEGSDDVHQVYGEAKAFLWIAQRVIFAVTVFFALNTVQPVLSSFAMTLLCNGIVFTAPETGLGMGAYLFYRGATQIAACASAASPANLAVVAAVNVISGIIAWVWYDKNETKDNLFNGTFYWAAENLAPWVAERITGKKV